MKNKSYDKKIFRLLHVLQRLNGREFVKTSDLAQEFSVTRRTIQRDLVLLESAGFLLDHENDGYQFAEGFSLQKITVTPAEKFLLNSFINLFSKAGAPLDGVASRFLGKFLSTPKVGSAGNIDSRRKAIIKQEVDGLARSIEAKLEDLRFPKPFQKKVDEFLNSIEGKLGMLKKSHGVDIGFTRTGAYSQRELVATISVPKTYFKDPYRDLDFMNQQKNRLLKIRFQLPNKYFKSLRVVLSADLSFKFWGPHLKVKNISYLDEFASYLGFSKNEKEFHYEASYGSKNNRTEILITRARISWQEVIPMPEQDINPFLKKTGGIWVVADYSNVKKERSITKQR
jgi:hypothetical protein